METSFSLKEAEPTASFVLPKLSKWKQNKFLGYANQVLKAQQALSDNNILRYILKNSDRYEHRSHYPIGDRIDHKTGSQYFYHCHRENYESAEHGHFHCFLRYKHIPKRIKPKALADWDKYIDNPMTHLVAVGMSQYGLPIRLFTVNRWVTSEIWYEAKHSPYFLKRFKITLEDDSYWQILDQWVEGILHLFAPQIEWLHQVRDARMDHYNVENPYIDVDIEELSEIQIDLRSQVEWVMG